eukprot:jgi/Mesen1/9785/ME000007S09849
MALSSPLSRVCTQEAIWRLPLAGTSIVNSQTSPAVLASCRNKLTIQNQQLKRALASAGRYAYMARKVGQNSLFFGGSLGDVQRGEAKWLGSTWLDNSAKVQVDVPVEEAYRMWEDPSQVTQWMPWIASVEVLDGQGQNGQPRSRWTLRYEAFGQKLEFSWLSQNMQPTKNQKIHWRSIDGLPNRGAVRFLKKGPTACQVELTITYEVPGILAPFAKGLTPLVEGIIQQDMERFAVYAKKKSLQSKAA